MSIELKRIRVSPGSELAALLEEAADTPLLLEKDGRLYRLAIEEQEDIRADYDPEAVREVIARTAGSRSDVDADKLIAALYRAREEDSRPISRP
jgi:hypothetical protein